MYITLPVNMLNAIHNIRTKFKIHVPNTVHINLQLTYYVLAEIMNETNKGCNANMSSRQRYL